MDKVVSRQKVKDLQSLYEMKLFLETSLMEKPSSFTRSNKKFIAQCTSAYQALLVLFAFKRDFIP